MNLSRIFLLTLAFTLAADLSCLADTNPAAKGKAGNTTTNLGPELEMVTSVFDVTSSPVKDPFFPHTVRVPLPAATNTNAAPVIDASSFVLKGLSGPPDKRLALINNRTLAVGETAQITTLLGTKVNIRCLAIKENSAVILSENQPGPFEIRYEEHFLKSSRPADASQNR